MKWILLILTSDFGCLDVGWWASAMNLRLFWHQCVGFGCLDVGGVRVSHGHGRLGRNTGPMAATQTVNVWPLPRPEFIPNFRASFLPKIFFLQKSILKIQNWLMFFVSQFFSFQLVNFVLLISSVNRFWRPILYFVCGAGLCRFMGIRHGSFEFRILFYLEHLLEPCRH